MSFFVAKCPILHRFYFNALKKSLFACYQTKIGCVGFASYCHARLFGTARL